MPIPHADEHVSAQWEAVSSGYLALGVGHGVVRIDAHDFACAAHFRPEGDIDAGEFSEWEDGFLHVVMRGDDLRGEAQGLQGNDVHVRDASALQTVAGHDLGGKFRHRAADGFADKWHGAAGAWIHFDDVEDFILDRKLDVHEADHIKRLGEFLGGSHDFLLHRLAEAERRDHASAVATVHASLFDVLHDGSDHGRFAIGNDIHIHFRRVFEESVH